MGDTVKKIAAIAIAIVAPYAIAAWTGFAVGTLANSLISFIAVQGANAIIGSLGGGSNRGGGNSIQDNGLLINKQGNTNFLPLVYGERRLGGSRVYVDTTDDGGATSGTGYLHIVLAVAQGGESSNTEIKSFDKIYFNNKLAWTRAAHSDGTTDGIVGAGHPDYDTNDPTADKDYKSNVSFRLYTGKDGQDRNSIDYYTHAYNSSSFAFSDDWTTNHDLRGVAYMYIILKYDRDLFPGAPTITTEITGKKLLAVNNIGAGPTDTLSEITNPANIIYDYLLSERYGKNIDSNDLNLASFQSARQWCIDAGISFNGAIDTGGTIFNNLQKLLQNAAMNLVFTNGEYYLQVLKEETFSGAYTFDKSNIIGDMQISLGNKRTRFNQFKVSFFNPSLEWQPDSIIIDDDSNSPATTYLADDSNQVNEQELELQMISDSTLAERIGLFYLNASRFQTFMRFTASHEAVKLSVGDPVYVTHDTPGYTNKKFRVQGMTLKQDTTVDIKLEEYPTTDIWLE